MKLVDAKTGKLVDVPDEEVQGAFQSGQYGFVKGDRIAVVKGEHAVTIDPSEAQKAFSSGYSLMPASEVRQRELEAKYGGIGHTIAAGAEGVARGLTLGLSDPLAIAIGGESVRKHLAEEQEVHPYASIGGEVVGSVAPLLFSGGASAPLEVGEAARLAKLAAEGAEVGEAALTATKLAKTARAASETARTAAKGADVATALADVSAASHAAQEANVAAETARAAQAAQATADATVEAARADRAAQAASLAGRAELGVRPPGAVKTILDATPAGAIGHAGDLAEKAVAAIVGEGSDRAVVRIAQKALATGARGSVEGALYGAGSQISEDALGDHETTASKMLAAVGHGALFGGVLGGALGGAGESAALALEHASPSLKKMAASQAVRSLSYGGLSSTKLTKSMERLPGGINGVGEELLNRGIVRPLDTFETLAPKIRAAANEAGAKTTEILRSSGLNTEGLIKAEDVAEDIRKAIHSEFGKMPELNASAISVAEKVAGDLQATYGQTGMSIEQLRDFRADLNKRIQWIQGPHVPLDITNEAKKIVYHELENTVERELDKAGSALKGDVLREYKDAKLSYARLINAQTMVEDSLSRAQKNQMFGLGEKMLLAAEIGGSAAAGHPYGVAKGLAAAVGSKAIKEHGNSTAAFFLDKVADLSAMRKTITQIDSRMSTDVQRFVEGRPTKATAARYTSKAERDRAYDLAAKRTRMGADVDAITDRIKSHLGTVASSAPRVALAFSSSVSRMAGYLASKLPKEAPLTTVQPQHANKNPVSDIDKDNFLRVYRAVDNPLSVVEDLTRGEVTPDAIEAVRICYPPIYAQMQRMVLERISEPDAPKLKYDQLVQLGVLLNVPTTSTLDPSFVARMQSMYQSGSGGEPPKPRSRKIELDTSPMKLSGFGGKI